MKLIKTKNYLLLIDEEAEIKEGDIVVHNFGMGYEIEEPCDKDNLKSNTRFKIIAHYPLTKEAKELDLPLLPNPFEEDNMEKLADNYAVDTQKVHPADSFIAKQSYIEGYKAAQSKQFSLEDMKKAFEAGHDSARKKSSYKSNGTYEEDLDKYIQSLSTQQLPKEFIPEYKKVHRKNSDGEDIGFPVHPSDKLKTITNSEGKKELVGKYKY